MTGNEVGVQVCQKYMLDAQAVFGSKGLVLIGIALGIDDCSGTGQEIADKVRSMRQTTQRELFKNHRSISFASQSVKWVDP
jgi:hypothetical protein